MAILPLSIFFLLLHLGNAENVETRIHLMMKPTGSQNIGFGTSLIATSKSSSKTIFAGSPKYMNAGGIAECPFVFNTLQNRTMNCSNFPIYGAVNESFGTTIAKIRSESRDYVLACGNQYTVSCPDAEIQQRMIGRCQSYSLGDGSTTDLTSPCPNSCPRNGLYADLVFVMDASGSVTGVNFRNALQWTISVLRRFKEDVDNQNIHVGFVVFASAISVNKNLKGSSYEAFRAEINRIGFTGGGTATSLGIRTSRMILQRSIRPLAAKVMIVVTDGAPNSAALTNSEAQQARSEGITMIAVGVGAGIRTDQLQLMANGVVGDNTRVMTVTDYNNLDSILGELSNIITETATTSIEGSSSNSTTELTQCQIGNSIHATNESLLIGAVGSYDRTGTAAEFKNLNQFPDISSAGHLNNTELKLLLNLTNGLDLKESYFGYSVSSGDMMGDSSIWIVMSAPRYLSRGLVLIYNEGVPETNTGLHPREESGLWQLGAYYGHCVLVMDINKDGFDDLLVSSPLFSQSTGYDEGIVFVYMNNPASPGPSHWDINKFNAANNCGALNGWQISLSGGNSIRGVRFGFTIVNGGDVDRNNYDDIIVGGPAEESDSEAGSGAIYIYFSSASGVSDSRMQKILGRAVSTEPISGFGSSIYGGIDFDDNGYSDIAVSAPFSDRIILLRSRDVITVTSSVSLMPDYIDVINCIALTNSSCSTIRICISAEKEHSSNILETFGLNLNITLDSLIGDATKRRLKFMATTTNILSITDIAVGSTMVCRSFEVQIQASNLGDLNGNVFETQLLALFNIDLSDSHKNQIMSGVLNHTSKVRKTASWNISKGCNGINGRCEHDLDISATYSENVSSTPVLLLGDSKKLTVQINFHNYGPDHAYFTQLNITSGNLTLIQVVGTCVILSDEESDRSSGLTVLKYRTTFSALSDLMLVRDRCNFTIEFDFSTLQSTAVERELYLKGVIYSNAGGEETAFDPVSQNNGFEFRKSLLYKAVVVLDGSSAPESMFYNRTTNISFINTLEDEVLGGNASDVVQTFKIYNSGPLGLASSKVKLSWPEMTKDGFFIFYMVDMRCEPDTACVCHTTGKMNKLNIAPKSSSNGSYVDRVTVTYPASNQTLISSQLVNCENSQCEEIFCDLTFLPAFERVNLIVNFKPWIPTFGETSRAQILSTLQLIPPNVTYGTTNTVKQVKTTLSHFDSTPTPEPVTNNLNIGAIIGAAIGGLLLLCLIVLALWKAGFFKSKYGEKTRVGRRTIRESRRAQAPADEDGGEDVPDPNSEAETMASTSNVAEIQYENI